MSYRDVTWAHSVELQTIAVAGKPSVTAASMKSVLVALADRRNTKTGQCNPSQDTLARDTALSVSTVNRALAGLTALGFIEKQRNPIGGGGRYADSYIFHTEMRTSQTAKVAEEEDEPRKEVERTSQTANFLPINKPGKENRETNTRNERDELFEIVWIRWPRGDKKKDAKEKFARLTKAQAPIVARAIEVHGDAYRAHVAKQYTPHLISWLNQERWTEEPPEPRAASTNGTPTPMERMRATLALVPNNSTQEIA